MCKYLKTPLRFGGSVVVATWLACAALPAAAAPDDPDNGTDVAVRDVGTAGLDLANGADRAILRHRIAVAAMKVCEKVTNNADFHDPGFSDCFSRALSGGRENMDTLVAKARTRAMVASGSTKP